MKEEEKYLVNEFETNGFDENEEDEDEDDLHTFDSDFSTTNRIVNSLKVSEKIVVNPLSNMKVVFLVVVITTKMIILI